MTTEQCTLCDRLKRLGYASDMQVKLYGRLFDLTSDPVFVDENFIFVDGLEHKSGIARRVRIPLSIVSMAKRARAA